MIKNEKIHNKFLMRLKQITFKFFVYWLESCEGVFGLEIWIGVDFGASHFSCSLDNRRSKLLKVSEDSFLDWRTILTSQEFRFRARNFNFDFQNLKISFLLFLSNLVSGPKNSNSAPSIWFKSKVSPRFDIFLPTKILILS